MNARRATLALVASSLLVSACRKQEITTYRVPKEAQPAAAPAATPAAAPAMPPMAGGGSNMANTAVATAGGSGLGWTAPAAWTAKPTGAMRKGSSTIKGAEGEGDLSITAFPGDVGGDLANLNRWRGQIQLPPVAQSEFEAATQHLDKNGLHLTFVDLVGTGATPQRILGVMVPFEGATWFFKLMGPDKVVAQEKTAFLQFIETIKPAAK